MILLLHKNPKRNKKEVQNMKKDKTVAGERERERERESYY